EGGGVGGAGRAVAGDLDGAGRDEASAAAHVLDGAAAGAGRGEVGELAVDQRARLVAGGAHLGAHVAPRQLGAAAVAAIVAAGARVVAGEVPQRLRRQRAVADAGAAGPAAVDQRDRPADIL